MMYGFGVLLFFTVCISWSQCKLNKYCSICSDHTMCQYQGIGQECEDVGDSGVTRRERKEIIDVHNWYRRLVAGGLETKGRGGPQPKAANMYMMTWDEELAKVAQRWADQCRFEHDTCRDDTRWKVGQNIYWKWKYPVHTVNWTEAIQSWYNEVSLFNPREVESYRFDGATGHYTQIVWHDTRRIGCGRRDYGQNKLYVCNYGPAGNWIKQPMYTIGEPCSKCPQGTRCKENLCAPPQKRVNNISKANAILRTSLHETTTDKAEDEENLDVLKPPKTDAIQTYDDAEEEEEEVGDNQTDPKVESRSTIGENLPEEPTTIDNSVNSDDITLDEETQSAIDEVKIKIEKVVKKVIRKMKSTNHQ